jgi:hypothetical protein
MALAPHHLILAGSLINTSVLHGKVQYLEQLKSWLSLELRGESGLDMIAPAGLLLLARLWELIAHTIVNCKGTHENCLICSFNAPSGKRHGISIFATMVSTLGHGWSGLRFFANRQPEPSASCTCFFF